MQSTQRVVLALCLSIWISYAPAHGEPTSTTSIDKTRPYTPSDVFRSKNPQVAAAKRLFDDGKLKEAETLMDRAIQGGNAPEDFYTMRADIRDKERNFEGAVADLNQAIGMTPTDDTLFVRRARVMLKVSQLEAMDADIKHALKINPNNYEAIALQGGLYFKLGRLESALREVNLAISKDSKQKTAYFWRGAIKYKNKQYKDAIADFTTSINLDPKRPHGYQSRGCAYGAMGEYQKALDDFNQSIQLKVTNSTIYYNRGRLFRLTKQYDKALKDLNQAIRDGISEKEPSVPVFDERAEVYLALGRSHQALIDLNHAIKLNNRDARAYLLRSQTYRQLGNMQASLKDSSKATELGASVHGVRPPAAGMFSRD